MNKNGAKSILSIMIVSTILLCTGCGNSSGTTTSATGTAVMKKAETNKNEIRYVAEKKEYGLALPEAESFKEELEELLYHACVSAHNDETTCFYDYLKKNGILGKEQKVILYYDEGKGVYFDQADEIDRPYYEIYLDFPEIQGQKQSYIRLCDYNARGACEVMEEESMEIFSKERKSWKKWGETTILLDESKAGQRITEEQEEDVRKQIREDCLEEIREYCGKGEEYDIYLYDFLPGDEWISGIVLDAKPDRNWPESTLSIHVCYKGKKMEKYNGITWSQKTHGTSLGKVPEEDALATIRSVRNNIIAENCFLACRVKGDQIISLQQE